MNSETMDVSRRTVLTLGGLSVVSGLAGAQTFPARPLKMIVPFPAGGPTDTVARLVAVKMGEFLGHPFVVENRAGATGMIGSSVVASAPPDGYQIVMGTVGTHVQAPMLAAKTPYDARKDFSPVSLIATAPLLLVCAPSLNVNTVAELVALMKAAPGRYSYASSGVGSPLHLAGALFEKVTGTTALHVPYKGSAPALQAVMTGEVAFFFDVATSAVPFVQSARVRGLAVTGASRLQALDSIATMREAGFPRVDAYTWNALFAPPQTPPAVLARLTEASIRAVKDPQVARKLSDLGLEPVGSKSADLAALVAQEVAKWKPVIDSSGLKGTL